MSELFSPRSEESGVKSDPFAEGARLEDFPFTEGSEEM